jgi:hypothetical protein
VSVRVENARFWVDDRADLFQDEELLRETVRVAFEPLIETSE